MEVTEENFVDLNDYSVIDCMMYRAGTKKAGNLLDGQFWQQMPEVPHE